MRKRKNQTLIVVPTYNEKGNIETVYQKIFCATKACDLLFVDDNSPDGTGKIAETISCRDSHVKVLHRPEKMGLGSAYVHGMEKAVEWDYRFVIAMDADLSHDPANIPRMLELVRVNDLIIGSRYVKDGGMVNWGMWRFFISRSANHFARWILGIRFQDCSGGYKCYRVDLLRKIGLQKIFSFGYSFQVEILFRALRAGAKIDEFPIVFVNRHEGESKLTAREMLQYVMTVLKLRWMAWAGRI